jgi:hypothetical protein
MHLIPCMSEEEVSKVAGGVNGEMREVMFGIGPCRWSY